MLAVLIFLTTATLLPVEKVEDKPNRPNIIVILTDDMGYSDIGCYGSEIETPNLDQLAENRIRYTRFYNTGRCCPSRASIMTGLYAHRAGMGGMTRDEGAKNPGYRGRLMPNTVTIAEVLKENYATIHTGKWHLGDQHKAWWPHSRGFEANYSCPEGGGFYFKPSDFQLPRSVVQNDQVLYDQKNDPPEGWYATDAWTDEGLKLVQDAVDRKEPFFWYLAVNTPHFPLQAKPDDVAKYKDNYLIGWDELRERRFQKLIALGLIDKTAKLPPRDLSTPAWGSLSKKQQKQQAHRMATYAAMIDNLDQNIGKIINQLKETNQFDNTLIFFMHDNGGCADGGRKGKDKDNIPAGPGNSFSYYGQCWAEASNTPMRKYKTWCHEGGIATPLIAHWPAGIAESRRGQIDNTPSHLIDILPTCLDVAQATYPDRYNGNAILKVDGVSLRNSFANGQATATPRPLFFEHGGNKAVICGNWKLVAERHGVWELYDLSNDRGETKDLVTQNPKIAKRLEDLYTRWSARCNVK